MSGASATSAPCRSPGGRPMTFDGLPRGGKGYKEASAEIEREIRKLWEWLAGVHELGRPRRRRPAAMTVGGSASSARVRASTRRRDRRHGRDRRLPERRQVDADQPSDGDAHRRRPRDAGRDARSQGAALRMVRARRSGSSTRAASTAPTRGRSARRSPRRRARRSRRPTSCSSSSMRPAGVTPGDEELAEILRTSRRPVLVLANKLDDPRRDLEALEFHRLGLGDPIPDLGAARPRLGRPPRRDRRAPARSAASARSVRRRSRSRSSAGRMSASRRS